MDGLEFSQGPDGINEGGAESTQEAIERFREQSKKSATQAKKDQKQEKKKKDQEDVLSNIILQFLKNKKYSGFFLLISRILSKNVPADFILSLLALIHQESAKILDAKKIPLKKAPPQKTTFPPEIMKPLSSWTTLIFSVSSANPHKILETVLDHEWKLDNNLVQLFSLILKEFFAFKKFDTPFENIQNFSKTFLQNLANDLEKQVQNQPKLGE